MLKKTNNDFLRVPVVLHDLQELAFREKALSILTALNKIISSSQEEVEFLYESDGIHIITEFLKRDNNLTNICLKILANASKRNEKVRSKLRNHNIFQLLAAKLQTQKEYSNSSLILCSALIVMLVQGSSQAQNLMRTSGCLTSMIHILTCILDEAEVKPVPCKSTELVVYAIIVSSKDPRQPENQSEIGRITPKILEYLEKQTLFSDVDQLQIVKCLWLFLKCALDQNERNQQIFLNHSGLSILFRSMQNLVDKGECKEMGDLLLKITGVLIKLKSHTDFLNKASSYCPLMILCSLLNTDNSLVVQHIIIFLDDLTKQVPSALEVIKDGEILKRIKRAKVMFLRSQAASASCHGLLSRLEMPQGEPTTPSDSNSNESFRFTSNMGDFTPNHGLEFCSLRNYLCVVHDSSAFDLSSRSLYSSLESAGGTEDHGEKKKLFKIRSSTGSPRFSKKDSREKEKNLRKIIQTNFSRSSQEGISRCSIAGLLGEKIMKVFRRFCSFSFADPVGDVSGRFALEKPGSDQYLQWSFSSQNRKF